MNGKLCVQAFLKLVQFKDREKDSNFKLPKDESEILFSLNKKFIYKFQQIHLQLHLLMLYTFPQS